MLPLPLRINKVSPVNNSFFSETATTPLRTMGRPTTPPEQDRPDHVTYPDEDESNSTTQQATPEAETQSSPTTSVNEVATKDSSVTGKTSVFP